MTEKKDTPQHSLSESLNENPLIQWVANNGKDLLLGFAILVLALILLFQYTGRSQISAANDYIEIENKVAIMQQHPDVNSGTMDETLVLLENHPELHAKYDGELAQILINLGNNKKAKELSGKAFSRTTDQALPFYSYFAKTTLLIQNQQHEKALKHANILKQKMDEHKGNGNRPFGDTLYALNLLRIGMLQQKLGLKQQEKSTWEEWKKYLNSDSPIKGIDPEGFRIVKQQFEKGNRSLVNYFDIRIKESVAYN